MQIAQSRNDPHLITMAKDTKSDDPLGGELTLSAELTESGIKAAAKSRTLSAIDRLVGNFLDLANPLLERFTRLMREKTETQANIIQAYGDAAAQFAKEDKELARQFAVHVASKELKKFNNRKDVATKTVDLLKSETGETNADVEGQISDQWMEVFSDFAEKATQDDVKDLWAHVLAREINQPNSFSIRTLRVISELDRDTAKLFQRYTSKIIDGLLLKDDPSPESFKELTALDEAGLIMYSNDWTPNILRTDENGRNDLRVRDFVFACSGQKNAEYKVYVIPVTTAGREIISILPPLDIQIGLDAIGAKLSEVFDSVKLTKSMSGSLKMIKQYK